VNFKLVWLQEYQFAARTEKIYPSPVRQRDGGFKRTENMKNKNSYYQKNGEIKKQRDKRSGV